MTRDREGDQAADASSASIGGRLPDLLGGEEAVGRSPDSFAEDGKSHEFDSVLRLVAHAPARPTRLEPIAGMRWGPSGRYVIVKRLADGGMGEVFEARDDLLGRVVALKVLKDAGGDGEAARSRILREARLAARVEHERIARVYDVAEHEETLFVAMELVRGRTLREYINHTSPARRFYNLAHVLDLAIQITEGLAEVHDKGVFHRDLKPENIILSPSGVKLLDFGLARQHRLSPAIDPAGAGASEGHSLAGLSGTPGYMAPEQYQGHELDARVDVFALGVIIYELMTGRRPFPGDLPIEILTAMSQSPAFSAEAWREEPFGHHARGMVRRLQEATRCMLRVNPDERFTDGSEALQALLSVKHRLVGAERLGSRRGLDGDVLWVDDQPEHNRDERRLFEEVGVTVTTVTSTALALRHIRRRHSPATQTKLAAVISDMGRKEGPMEGYALLSAMRSLGDATPFFIYSTSNAIEYKEKIHELGGQGSTNDSQELFEMVMSTIDTDVSRARHPMVPPESRIAVEVGDITTLLVDAIVTSTNGVFSGEGELDRSVHRAAGPGLRSACAALRGCALGDAKITGGYGLAARFVIHTVGPLWQGGGQGEAGVLASCYWRSIALAREHGLRTLALPCIGTGVNGFPMEAAARIAVATVLKALAFGPLPESVTLCAFSRQATVALTAALDERRDDLTGLHFMAHRQQ